ncbi:MULTISPECIES: hypothetical protein [Burkholderia]|uniref:hypothetical protein n=1 Tax=Burkholderia TaxID=32008 RepID=UPI00076DB20D|nr:MULTISPECIES: hypothetical protein [Burkholderia]KVM86548.1 hypothetical protein WT06_22890 [Burkholderia anthina]MCA8107084.1 hypothetical protein [Burkholderia sp. AU36459]
MSALLDDFSEWNTVAAIVVRPKIRGHSGVHGIDADISRIGRPSSNGTIRMRFSDSFRSMEFF